MMLEHNDWFWSNLTILCKFKNRCDRTNWILSWVYSRVLIRVYGKIKRDNRTHIFGYPLQRREGDSNPRYVSVNTLSKRARSATLPPLRVYILWAQHRDNYRGWHHSNTNFLGRKNTKKIFALKKNFRTATVLFHLLLNLTVFAKDLDLLMSKTSLAIIALALVNIIIIAVLISVKINAEHHVELHPNI